MKRTILIIALFVIAFASCTKPHEPTGTTTYSIESRINFSFVGYDVDAIVYEYDAAGQRIDSNIVESPVYGKQYIFAPNEATTNLKLKLVSSENTVRWANKIFAIIPFDNIAIVASLSMVTDPNCYCFNEPF